MSTVESRAEKEKGNEQVKKSNKKINREGENERRDRNTGMGMSWEMTREKGKKRT